MMHIPVWNNITEYWPSYQTETHHWRNGFREGAKELTIDEVHVRVATIYNGKKFLQKHVIDVTTLSIQDELPKIRIYIESQLKSRLEHDIERVKNNRRP